MNPEEENIIWVDSKPISKCPGLINVIVGDELGNTFWLLYHEEIGFTEFKHLNEGLKDRVKCVDLKFSKSGTLVCASLISSSESWIAVYEITKGTIQNWMKELKTLQNSAQKTETTESNEAPAEEGADEETLDVAEKQLVQGDVVGVISLAGSADYYKLKAAPSDISIQKHDFSSIYNSKDKPLDCLGKLPISKLPFQSSFQLRTGIFIRNRWQGISKAVFKKNENYVLVTWKNSNHLNINVMQLFWNRKHLTRSH